MTTHGEALDAAHVQSRVVVIATVPVPPAAGTDATGVSAVTWHFGVDGEVRETEEEPQALARMASDATASRDHRNKGRTDIRRTPGLCKHFADPCNGRPALSGIRNARFFRRIPHLVNGGVW